ncbi:MAG: TetR/AcrR family transcriptional regulator [Acidobacteria bacterium]|nr:TetR/AcrR family transcriptional regulator [Acidobacteriota bacterium]
MPKLAQETIEENKDHIEEAAKKLFIKHGFHGTSMRLIAGQADVSLGNLYNYYKTKEDILESIINKYELIINTKLKEIFDETEEPLLPDNLIKFGKKVQKLVEEHYEFWLLMYIDVLEFENRHCRKMFENLKDRLNKRFYKHFNDLKDNKNVNITVDPAIGFTVAYLQFFNYFLIEKLFGGNNHLGISDDEAIIKLSEIFSRAIFCPATLEKFSVNK